MAAARCNSQGCQWQIMLYSQLDYVPALCALKMLFFMQQHNKSSGSPPPPPPRSDPHTS